MKSADYRPARRVERSTWSDGFIIKSQLVDCSQGQFSALSRRTYSSLGRAHAALAGPFEIVRPWMTIFVKIPERVQVIGIAPIFLSLELGCNSRNFERRQGKHGFITSEPSLMKHIPCIEMRLLGGLGTRCVDVIVELFKYLGSFTHRETLSGCSASHRVVELRGQSRSMASRNSCWERAISRVVAHEACG